MDTNTTLLIVNVALTSFVTIVTSMRLRCRCGKNSISLKPKDAPPSPGSVEDPASPPQPSSADACPNVVVNVADESASLIDKSVNKSYGMV